MTRRDYPGPDSRRIQKMFAEIAPRYDFLNHFLSISIDRHWRRVAAAKVRDLVGTSPELCLDACSGTGDLAIALGRALKTDVIAADFCHPMLIRATEKAAGRLRVIEADALELPFPNGCFDVVTMAFGLRNLEDRPGGLNEIRRVLRPGGAIVLLEFSKPVIPVFRQAFEFYFNNVLPAIGSVVSGDSTAYRYLHDSVREFPDQEKLLQIMRTTGFVNTGYRNLSGGIAALHWGRAGRGAHT
jgi:demethylmenaquinone methyltransferase/2-methoxy-6-polyprenyl-1,4-benzoquinol methylase